MRMIEMKSFAVLLLVLLCAGAGPITVNSPVDDVLDALDARGKDLKTLSADMKTSDIDPSIGDVADIRTGRFFYQVLADGNARFHAIFDKKITGRKVQDVKLEWSYADGKLIERDYRNQTQHTHQIMKPGETLKLFNLDGPFPLPLGQDKADVHSHFAVKEIPADKDDPPATVHLQMTPIAGTELARKFKTLDVWVDPKTDMPIRISVLDDTNQKVTDLSNVKVNEPIPDGDFDLEKVDLDQGWQRTDD